jgi:hypothetical protein
MRTNSVTAATANRLIFELIVLLSGCFNLQGDIQFRSRAIETLLPPASDVKKMMNKDNSGKGLTSRPKYRHTGTLRPRYPTTWLAATET